eukprot:TRINITY_DN6073_c0_g1_i2.p1 TRINITY_DN6073_c0_g1~~TRINITY_DN6073_c0_g1_i2.p1  ORF type:complete len:102 (-),score=8.84 TRINITY_DN6073_c0_g1_i2:245-550(-)
MKSSRTNRVFAIDPGTCLKQSARNYSSSFAGCIMKSSPPTRILLIHCRPMLEQETYDLHVAAAACRMKRSPSLIVCSVDIRNQPYIVIIMTKKPNNRYMPS